MRESHRARPIFQDCIPLLLPPLAAFNARGSSGAGCAAVNVNNGGYSPYEHVYARGLERPGDRFPAGDNRKLLPGGERKPRIRRGRRRRRRRRAVVSGLIARLAGGQLAQFAAHVAPVSLPPLRPSRTGGLVVPPSKRKNNGRLPLPLRSPPLCESPSAEARAAALRARVRCHFRFPPLSPSGFNAAHRRQREFALHYDNARVRARARVCCRRVLLSLRVDITKFWRDSNGDPCRRPRGRSEQGFRSGLIDSLWPLACSELALTTSGTRGRELEESDLCPRWSVTAPHLYPTVDRW